MQGMQERTSAFPVMFQNSAEPQAAGPFGDLLASGTERRQPIGGDFGTVDSWTAAWLRGLSKSRAVFTTGLALGAVRKSEPSG